MARLTFEEDLTFENEARVFEDYFGLVWTRFLAVDDGAYPGYTGYSQIFTFEQGSPDTTATNSDPTNNSIFESARQRDDFDLDSACFASAFNDEIKITVAALDNGEKVATKTFFVDQQGDIVKFGRKFDDIDEVRIRSSGGTDANPGDGFAGSNFVLDDLSLTFF